ncbi:DUF357 domain-containing protein [Archaeoglobales archaeon]|nr:MAG: DUF357 domain-containing protein [Archaeoglobales archaeon]
MLEDELRSETLKWLERLEKKIKNVEGDDRFLRNINAYAEDTKFFLDKGDLIRAFECVVWAWAWLEIGLEVGKLKSKIQYNQN